MFPGHVCCTFQNSVNAIPRKNAFRKKEQKFFAKAYIYRENITPKATEETREITVKVKRLRNVLGA